MLGFNLELKNTYKWVKKGSSPLILIFTPFPQEITREAVIPTASKMRDDQKWGLEALTKGLLQLFTQTFFCLHFSCPDYPHFWEVVWGLPCLPCLPASQTISFLAAYLMAQSLSFLDTGQINLGSVTSTLNLV